LFWHDFKPSPIHIKGGLDYHPGIKALFKAFDNMDPPTRRQKATTPKLLRKLLEASHHSAFLNTAPAVVANHVIGAFFFAMRACEHAKPRTAGKTKCIDLDGIVFHAEMNDVIEHDNPRLLEIAEHATITFVNQKNGIKMDSRTQRRTKDLLLCPVLRHDTQVQRILCAAPDATGPSTKIKTIAIKGKAGHITSAYILELLRATCSSFGGEAIFGFSPEEIGNKSTRSGAAMALFINNVVPAAKITILGRWSSDAFLAHIGLQVLEWTNNMSRKMITVDSFFDAQINHHTTTADPRTRANRHSMPFNGPAVIIPRLHLNHQTVQWHGKPFQGRLFTERKLGCTQTSVVATAAVLLTL
jgi:hypothetical protein